MLVRFSVAAFLEGNERLSLVGSLSCLGGWNASSGIPLVPIVPPVSSLHPTFWSVIVEIPDPADFEFKYIKWRKNIGHLPTSEPPVTFQNETTILAPSAQILEAYSAIPSDIDPIEWEGRGGDDNRKFIFTDPVDASQLNLLQRGELMYPDAQVHRYDPDFNNVIHSASEVMVPTLSASSTSATVSSPRVDWKRFGTSGSNVSVYSLQSSPFANNMSEYCQTTQYYQAIKYSNDIDYNKVLDRVYVGSCPRQLSHYQTLKDNLRISTIMNFQAVDDIGDNWPDPIGFPDIKSRTPSALYEIAASTGINYVWLPTKDMDCDGRATIAAQASWILAGLLANKQTTGVYVHCNAGVGRSSSCVAGYMINCLGQSIRKTNLLLCMRRSMAYFDVIAQIVGKLDYTQKFGDVAQRCLLPSTPNIATSPNPNGRATNASTSRNGNSATGTELSDDAL